MTFSQIEYLQQPGVINKKSDAPFLTPALYWNCNLLLEKKRSLYVEFEVLSQSMILLFNQWSYVIIQLIKLRYYSTNEVTLLFNQWSYVIIQPMKIRCWRKASMHCLLFSRNWSHPPWTGENIWEYLTLLYFIFITIFLCE